jgi:GT2 family glycosyltransferase
MTTGPLVSVIIPAYLSHDTIDGCLAALERQLLRGAEVIVVDSSPDEATADAVRRFPSVRLERTACRMLPHAARNRGAALATGSLLAFTDPDVYPASDWLERLVGAHRRSGGIVVGALACHGHRWLDTGIHLCKFSPWLPGGAPRHTDMAPTAGMLLARSEFVELGGFPGRVFQGDAVFSWRARRRGLPLWFEPRAVAWHHHLTGVGSFLSERSRRGLELGGLRAAEWGHSRARDLLFLIVSLLPVRLLRVMALTVDRGFRAGALFDVLWTAPIVLAGHLVELIGEGFGFGRDLLASARPDQEIGGVERGASR